MMKPKMMLLPLVVVVLLAQTVSADWEFTYTLDPNPCRQDETLEVEVVFTNTADEQMRLLFFGIHFDWMVDNIYYANPDSDDEPIPLAIGENTTLNITFTLDAADVPVESAYYHFFAKYELKDDFFGYWTKYEESSEINYDFKVLEKDRDGDSYGDSEDAFPDDPNEWKDTDLDGVGDNRDAYPDNPKKWKNDDDNGSPGFGLGILMVAIIITLAIKKR